jgi:acyl-CoA synthetase (AMP-forming)/AMP-acid ligase II
LSPIDAPAVAWAEGDDLGAIVARFARTRPDDVALAQGDRVTTWGQLGRGMDRIAAGLARRAAPGERVALLTSVTPEAVEVFLGILRAGLCAVPLPSLASPESLALMLADSGASIIVASPGHRDLAAAVAAGRPLARVSLGFEGPGWDTLDAVAASATGPFTPPAIGDRDAFDVIYSSGTTGVPKGIVHSHAARKASYAGSRGRYFSGASVNLLATPLYSNTTCVTWFLTTAAGGRNVLLEKFSTDAFFDAVERQRVTHAMLVPVQHERVLAAPRIASADLSSLKYLFCTSAPLRVPTKRALLERTSAEVVEIYGLTEGGPVTVLEARQHPDKLASVGRPSPGVDLRIVDDDGHEVPRGGTGEVIGRSGNLMTGYLNRPDETAAMLLRTPDGTTFLRTGDLGRLDEDGFLYLVDRKKDVIISGGFNVYATDLEAVLLQHPDVSEACVIGIPSERWGETPLGLVVLKDGAGEGRGALAGSIATFANERLGKLQRLSSVEIRGSLPRNAIGKVLKRELRAVYLSAARPAGR